MIRLPIELCGSVLTGGKNEVYLRESSIQKISMLQLDLDDVRGRPLFQIEVLADGLFTYSCKGTMAQLANVRKWMDTFVMEDEHER